MKALFRTKAAAALCLAALLAPGVHAAPMASTGHNPGIDASAVPAPGSAATLPGSESVDTPGTGGATRVDAIELLLRMQTPTGAASAATVRPAPQAQGLPTAARSDTAEAPTLLHELKEWKASVLGEGATRAEGAGQQGARQSEQGLDQPQATMGGWAGPAMSGDGGGRSSAGAVSGRTGDGGFLAHPVVRFIRENRALSIGASIGLLAAVWLTTHYRSRGQRRRSRRA